MHISNILLSFVGFGLVLSVPAPAKKDRSTTIAATTATSPAARVKGQTTEGQTTATPIPQAARKTTTPVAQAGRKTTTPVKQAGRKTTTPVKGVGRKPTSTPQRGRTTTTSTRKTSTVAAPVSGKPTRSPGKRGLAYNDAALTDYFSLSGQGSKVNWAYNWASDPYEGAQSSPGSFNPVLDYVPMLWSNAPALTSKWTANVQNAMRTYGSKYVMAFNEPDGCGQGSACMSMSDSVSAYQQYVQPLAGTVQLGAPAVTNAVGDDLGANWLKQFFAQCTKCTFDFIPIHWYGSATDPTAFKNYVSGFYKQFGKPIWVTEFGTNGGTEAQVDSFLKSVLPWLDQQAYVKRYAYFMDLNSGSPYLLNKDNSFTSEGSIYNSG